MINVITEFFAAARQADIPFVFIRPKKLQEPDIFQGDFDLLVKPESLMDFLAKVHETCSQKVINFRIDRVKLEKTTVTWFTPDGENSVEFDLWTELDIKDSALKKGTHISWQRLEETQGIIKVDNEYRLANNIAALFYLSHMHSKNKKIAADEVQFRLDYFRQLPDLDSDVRELLVDVTQDNMRQANQLLKQRGLLCYSLEHRIAKMQSRWQKARAKSSKSMAVIGPDGVGKTTIIEHLAKQYHGKYYRFKKMFRKSPLYTILLKLKKKSLEKQLHVTLDKNQFDDLQYTKLFWISLFSGYLHTFICRLGRRTIYDRFYPDLLLTGSRSLETPIEVCAEAKKWMGYTPVPACVIQLDAPEATILARKEELSAHHISAFRRHYFELTMATQVPTYVYVNTHYSLEATFQHLDQLKLKL